MITRIPTAWEVTIFKRIPNPFISTFSNSISLEMGDYTTTHVSGQVGNDASDKVTARSFEEEAALCLANMAKVLEHSGAGLGRRADHRLSDRPRRLSRLF